MKRHSSAFTLVLAVLITLGLEGSVFAGEQVPFRGRFEGIAIITLVPDTTLRLVDVSAKGNATQLGSFRLEIPHFVDVAPTPQISFGSYQFVAANGDTLSASFAGEVRPAAPGVGSAVEIATITGGTGRFAGATGSFTVERFVLVNHATGVRTTIGTFEGTISSLGAAKKLQP